MRRILKTPFYILASIALFTSCKKNAVVEATENAVSDAVISQIKAMGFSTNNVIKDDGGYIVEGDIFIPEENLNDRYSSPSLIVANEEQYRTTNLVTRLPRVITVSVTGLTAPFSTGTDDMIAKYNAQNLLITFQRAPSGTKGDIDIIGFNQAPSGGYITLGSSGFPTKSGNPYRQIKMNTNQYAYGTNPDPAYISSVLQHEVGHCIGFRHTDYMNRSFSCGGTAVNEGAGSYGAIHIPGTPTDPERGSWMLACSDGTNRTFNANDKIALNYLY